LLFIDSRDIAAVEDTTQPSAIGFLRRTTAGFRQLAGFTG
jgi:hypothetical protein